MKALLEPIKEIARFDELFRDLKKGTAGVTVISGCLGCRINLIAFLHKNNAALITARGLRVISSAS